MDRVGLTQLAESIGHSWTCAALSMGFFILAMLAHIPAVAQALSVGVAETLHNALLTGTFVLTGIPQFVESIGAAASGHIDTHVLMMLAVMGTLYMGLAHEVSKLNARERVHVCARQTRSNVLRRATPSQSIRM